jgi:hypothetical protein
METIPTSIDQQFRGSYFRGARPIREKREILHHVKISRYIYGIFLSVTLSTVHVQM